MRGAFHSTKISENSGSKSNGTENFRKIFSKILVNLSRGAFHSTKYSGLKFRVFYATNGTVFRFVGLTNPRSSGSKFRTKIRDANGGLFYLCLLALGLFDDSEVEINDVLGEGDNITFIVRI